MIRTLCPAVVCVVVFGAAPAMATTFSFNAAAPTNSPTPFAISAAGVTATFNSPSGGGAFIAEDGSAFATLGTSVLADDNFAPEELDIAFSQVLGSIGFAFATNDLSAPTALTLTATLNGVKIGSVSTIGTIAASGLPEGSLSFGGASFNAVQIVDNDPSNEGFAIGAVTVAVPEPSGFLAMASGLLGLVALRRRRG